MVVSTHWGCPLTGQDFTHGEQGIHSLWTLRRHSEVLFVARQVSQEMGATCVYPSVGRWYPQVQLVLIVQF